jgi:hypothetical protein
MHERAKLDSFIDRFTPEVAADARRALASLGRRLPAAFRLVYDNYNALVVGFASGEKASDAFLSIALYPQYVRLFFLRGVELPDPHRLLEGSGSRVRSIKLKPASRIEAPEVCALIESAVAIAEPPLPVTGDGPLIIKSISGKQRARRPA